MFGHFGYFREKLLKRRPKNEVDLSVENSNLTPDQISTALKALRILGLEGKCQQFTKHHCIMFLYAMGLNPTDDIIDSKLRAFKLQYRTTFTFGQLVHIWHSMLKDLTDEDEVLKRAFQFFDKDGNGEISVQELRTTMHELGDLLSEEELNAFMHILDVNQDGAIGYNEFLVTLKTQSSQVVELQEGEERQPEQQQPQPQSFQQQQQQQSSISDTEGATTQSPCERGTQPLNVPEAAAGQATTAGEAAPAPPLPPFPRSTRNSAHGIVGMSSSNTIHDSGGGGGKGGRGSPSLDGPQGPCLPPLAQRESQMGRSKDVLPVVTGTVATCTIAAGTVASVVTVGDGNKAGGLRTPSSLNPAS